MIKLGVIRKSDIYIYVRIYARICIYIYREIEKRRIKRELMGR